MELFQMDIISDNPGEARLSQLEPTGEPEVEEGSNDVHLESLSSSDNENESESADELPATSSNESTEVLEQPLDDTFYNDMSKMQMAHEIVLNPDYKMEQGTSPNE